MKGTKEENTSVFYFQAYSKPCGASIKFSQPICLSVCTKQLKNCWTDFNENWHWRMLLHFTDIHQFLLKLHVWEPPTTQNRQLPPCRKSRRHLYPTDYWNTAQALTKERQQLKLEWWQVSARPTARGIKMRPPDMLARFPVTLSRSEHLLYWRHKPAPLEIASIVITRQSLPPSRLVYSPLLGRTIGKSASRYAARSARCRARCSAGRKESQLAATQRAPPGVQPAARPDERKAS
jgi:hypothetical protein